MKEIIDALKKKLEVSSDDAARIASVIGECSAREEQYKTKISELNETLPDLFASVELGEIKKGEAEKIKATIRSLKERADETPMILKGLTKRAHQCQNQMRKTVMQIERIYKSLKDEISEYEFPDLIEDLKTCASLIGMGEDCEVFLAELERAKAE